MVTEIHQPGRYCADRRDEIIEYVFGEMGPGASEAFQSHLESCPGCLQEVKALRSTITEVKSLTALEASTASNGGRAGRASAGAFMDEEWSILHRRLRLQESLGAMPDDPAALQGEPAAGALEDDDRENTGAGGGGRRLAWMPAAAAVAVTAVLSFSAGYLLKSARTEPVPAETAQDRSADPASPAVEPTIAPPVAGAGTGNYFDNLEDFTRDTHNFLRRTRMLLMEFTNLGADSDPTFFRTAAGQLLDEARRYQAVASRMDNAKLGELLSQITGILGAISRVDRTTQARVVSDVKATMTLTDLLATLEILDAAVERDLEGQPNA